MAIHVPWRASEFDRVFKPCANGNGELHRRRVLCVDEADRRRTVEQRSCRCLHGPDGLGSKAFAPKAPNQCPLDLGFWPIVRVPEPRGADGLPGGLFNKSVGAIPPDLPVANHAAHGSPALAFRQGAAEREPRALDVAVVLMQCGPVFVNKLAEQKAVCFQLMGGSLKADDSFLIRWHLR